MRKRKKPEQHGETRGGRASVEYATWASMMRRCYNHNVQNYVRYGGKGVRVCRRWYTFTNFLTDMGRRPSARHSIERRRNDRNYTPNNCYWATREEQARNKSDCWRIRLGGTTRTVAEWARHLDVLDRRIYMRLRMGWTPKEAVLLPMSQRLRRPARDAHTLHEALRLLRLGSIRELKERKTVSWSIRKNKREDVLP